jgi:hypothetical protein
MFFSISQEYLQLHKFIKHTKTSGNGQARNFPDPVTKKKKQSQSSLHAPFSTADSITAKVLEPESLKLPEWGAGRHNGGGKDRLGREPHGSG